MARPALTLTNGEKNQLRAAFDRVPVVWYGHEPPGAHHDYAPELEAETDEQGVPTGKTVICPLVATAGRSGKLSAALAKKIIDKIVAEPIEAEPIEDGKTKEFKVKS